MSLSRIWRRGVLLLTVGTVALVLACGAPSDMVVAPSAGESASGVVSPAPGEAAPPVQSPAVEAAPPTDATAAPSEVDEASEPIEIVAEEPEIPAVATTGNTGGGVGDLAPDFVGITNWINSDPLTIENLRGKVVLVDVWTYTCINCIRTFPYLREWNDRYADSGLVIVGLHAPEFDFEKNTKNVTEAAGEYGIVWPIAQDNDYGTWNAYSNRFWPAKYLIDHNGVVRYTHFGEGKYAKTEERIRQLLEEAGQAVDVETMDLPQDQSRDASFSKLMVSNPELAEFTRELYAGYERNQNAVLYGSNSYVGQPTDYFKNRDGVASFEAPAELVPDKVYLNGDWHIGPESVKHARMTDQYEDYIAINYSAKSVNAVVTSDSGEPYRVRVTMDDEYLTEENKGGDVMIDADGESYILVDEPRLYAIVDNPMYTRRASLKLHPNSADFGLFAYTFGVYEEGP